MISLFGMEEKTFFQGEEVGKRIDDDKRIELKNAITISQWKFGLGKWQLFGQP